MFKNATPPDHTPDPTDEAARMERLREAYNKWDTTEHRWTQAGVMDLVTASLAAGLPDDEPLIPWSRRTLAAYDARMAERGGA